MIRCVLSLFVAAVFAAGAQAQLRCAILEPSKDNTLYDSPTGAFSNGRGSGVFVGQTGQGQVVRTVLAFDVAAAIPAGSVIQSAKLELQVSQSRPNLMTIEMRRLTRDWGEGSSVAAGGGGGGAPSSPGDATWIHTFFPNHNWAQAGGDFASTSSADAQVVSTLATWNSTARLVADVQDMLDNPANNFGWLLLGDETSNAKRFHSREAAPGLRPILEITYANRAAVFSFGAGCSSSTGRTLTLRANGLPQLGATWSQDSLGAGDGSLSYVFFAFGVALQPLPLGNGCDLLLDPASTALFAGLGISPYGPSTVANGVANHPIPIPNDPYLAGLGVDYQGILFDPPTPATVRSTNVLSAILGL